MSTPSSAINNDVSDISKVTPKKALQTWREKGGLMLLLLLCLFFFGFMLSPSKTKADVDMPTKPLRYEGHEETLNKNLALLAQMKKESVETPTPIPVLPMTPVTEGPKHPTTSVTPHLSKKILLRMNAPTTFMTNKSTSASSITQVSISDSAGSMTERNASLENTSDVLKQRDPIGTVWAKRLPHPDKMVPAGEMIPATLAVAMDSELPGMIVATTERAVYSLSGQHILIPRGSRLVGQYNHRIVQGQQRFLVIWQRVQLPNGVIASLDSPGSDDLGRSGFLADTVDNHFIERFGQATLLSLIGAFAANDGVDGNTQYNSAAAYRASVAASFNQTAQATFQRDNQIKPTLAKYQGAAITVFVAKDLDFSNVQTSAHRS